MRGLLPSLTFTLLVTFSYLVRGEYVLVWEDGFDKGQLTDRWEFEWGCGGWGNRELQCYTNNRSENTKQENGRLTITAVKEPWNSSITFTPYEFTSSRIKSKASFLYGKFVARMRLAKGTHLWPGFWMRPLEKVFGSHPASGEMDIVEYKGQNPTQFLGTIHFKKSATENGKIGSWINTSVDLSDAFHNYGFEWTPQNVTWTFDGEQVYSIPLDRNFGPGFYSEIGQPFTEPFYLTFNVAVGGKFFEEPFTPDMADSWIKPTLEVEHVKVYQWK